MIPFTDRELQKAWRENQQAAKVGTRTNAHRLLLFYSVECGLKAVLLKRQNKQSLLPHQILNDEVSSFWWGK